MRVAAAVAVSPCSVATMVSVASRRMKGLTRPSTALTVAVRKMMVYSGASAEVLRRMRTSDDTGSGFLTWGWWIGEW